MAIFWQVQTDFDDYMEHLVTGDPKEDSRVRETARFDSLEEYIDEWVRSGEAWKDCAHDFRIYSTAVSLIVADWSARRLDCKNESEWDQWIPYRIVKAFKDDYHNWGSAYKVPEILDPLYFQFWGHVQ
jgi:hypothetical protein